MKTLLIGILIVCLFSCSKNDSPQGSTAFNMTISGLPGGPFHFSDYSRQDSTNQYSINGRENYLSTNPVCWIQPGSGFYTFYFYDYKVTDSGTVVSEVTFGVPTFSSGTTTNDFAQTNMGPNIISGPVIPHFTFSQMVISLTLNSTQNSVTDGSFDVTGTDGVRNVHISGSFRGIQNLK
jgi:hypothetical protein